MKIVCLDAATLGSDADLSEIACLGEFESYEMTEPAQTTQRLAGADAVITNKVLITDEIMAQTTRITAAAANGARAKFSPTLTRRSAKFTAKNSASSGLDRSAQRSPASPPRSAQM